MNVNRPDCGFPVEAAHVAVWLVKAHQTVDHRHRLERPVDGRVKVSREAPLAATSTKVPSSGRARRTLSGAGLIQGEDPFDPFRHVPRRQGGAGYVANILVE